MQFQHLGSCFDSVRNCRFHSHALTYPLLCLAGFQGSRGGGQGHFGSLAGGKGSAVSKAARQAALLSARRALKKLEDWEAGRPCIQDPVLRDRLFCQSREQDKAATIIMESDIEAQTAPAAPVATPAALETATNPAGSGQHLLFQNTLQNYQELGKVMHCL